MPDNFFVIMQRCLGIFLVLFMLFGPPPGEISANRSAETLQVAFIDVGQGDCSLLSTSSGQDILIDAGPESAGSAVVSFLNAQGVTELDVIVISHNHADHIGGLVDLLQSPILVGEVFYNGNACTTLICQAVWAEMGKRGITPQAVDAGDSFSWGPLAAAVLNPQAVPTGDENEDSVVLDLDFFETDLIYTGDIGFATETLLINAGGLGPVEVLKVAHHGSAESSGTAFLGAVAPQAAVISVGASNPYGHPSAETLQRLALSGAAVQRTDLDGDVTFAFSSDGPLPIEDEVYLPAFRYTKKKTPHPTPAPIPTPTPVPTQTPQPMPGQNVRCSNTANVQICASVSDAHPHQYSYVTVYGRLVVGGGPVQGQAMASTWHYKTTTSYCSGVTSAGGLASCERTISRATVGYPVAIDVTINGYSVTTSFTPID